MLTCYNPTRSSNPKTIAVLRWLVDLYGRFSKDPEVLPSAQNPNVLNQLKKIKIAQVLMSPIVKGRCSSGPHADVVRWGRLFQRANGEGLPSVSASTFLVLTSGREKKRLPHPHCVEPITQIYPRKRNLDGFTAIPMFVPLLPLLPWTHRRKGCDVSERW